MAKKQGEFFVCLVPRCDVKKKGEKEILGHIVMDHQQVAERNVSGIDGAIEWAFRPRELKDVQQGWQDAHKYGEEKWKRQLDQGIIDIWVVAQTKKGWRKGVPRVMKGKSVEQVKARVRKSAETCGKARSESVHKPDKEARPIAKKPKLEKKKRGSGDRSLMEEEEMEKDATAELKELDRQQRIQKIIQDALKNYQAENEVAEMSKAKGKGKGKGKKIKSASGDIPAADGSGIEVEN